MRQFIAFFARAAVALSLALILTPAAQAERVPAGTQIGTATTVTYNVVGIPNRLTTMSNIPLVTIVTRPADTDLRFMRQTDQGSGSDYALGDVEYSTDPDRGSDWATKDVAEVVGSGREVTLTDAGTFGAGEPIFIVLNNDGLNHLPGEADVVEVRVLGGNGDYEVIRLVETGANTGEFIAALPSAPYDEADPGDGRIAIGPNTELQVEFIDPFHDTGIQHNSVTAEPRVRFYDALTGDPLDGAILTILDAETGREAVVHGVSGDAPMAGALMSGETGVDARGVSYATAPGEVAVPFLPAGSYRIEIRAPGGYVFPSDASPAKIAGMGDPAYRIGAGMRGENFIHLVGGPLTFDVPLDPRGRLSIEKSSGAAHAAPGDYAPYEILIENRDDRPAEEVVVTDVLPIGFRYAPGSIRINGAPAPDPEISDDGRTLTFRFDDIPAGAEIKVEYAVRIGSGAPAGPAISTSQAQALAGFRSNRAESIIYIGSPLGEERGAILGRVIVGECGAPPPVVDPKNPPEPLRARVYMETGRYVVTDADGLFNFSGVRPGAHALRLDLHSLPEGYEPHVCPGDLRPGDDALARTVELRGGLMRDVTFRLRRKAQQTAPAPAPAPAPVDPSAGFTVDTLAELERDLHILYPQDGASLRDPSLRIGIAYPFGSRVLLYVNGEPVDPIASGQAVANREARMAMKPWRGIDLPDGESVVEAVLTRNGSEIARREIRVHYVTEPERAELLPERSKLVADGKTAPVVAVRLTDAAGRPVHEGRRVSLSLDPPYQTTAARDRFENDPLAASQSSRSVVAVGPDGVALIPLRPTTRPGNATLRIALRDGEEVLQPWIAPAPRPWILVGLAEGSVGYENVSGNLESLSKAGVEGDVVYDGRVAFFAKGAIKGEWLLTLAYDSERGDRGRRDGAFDRIDPDAYYTVYGDASQQGEGAASRYPLYVRIENGQFYAMFGDYRTGLDSTRLAAYDRALSGFKTVYDGDRFSVVAFAAEADQQSARREFTADRGVGPYNLGAADIIRNSERVRLVVRDRERLSDILSERVLTPFVDYDLDYGRGELMLRRPPDPTDEAFNPAFIVVDFERDAPSEEKITAGGRAAVKALDGDLEVGVSALREDGLENFGSGELVALDATLKPVEGLELTAEAAMSRREDSIDGERDGRAFSAEAVYHNDGWRASAYLRQSDEDFGVAQQSFADVGRRIYGLKMNARLRSPFAMSNADPADGAAAAGPQAPEYRLMAHAYRDESLTTDARRDNAEALIARPVTIEGHGIAEVAVGYRGVRDRLNDGSERSAHRAVGRLSANLFDGWANVSLEREQTVVSDGTGWEPDSTLVTAQARLTDGVRARVALEAFDGESVEAANVHAGLDADLWRGGRVDLGLSALRDGIEGYEPALYARFGVAQDLKFTERLSGTLRLDRTQALTDQDSPVIASLFRNGPTTETATNASAGIGYGGEDYNASTRLDLRDGETARSATLSASVSGDIAPGVTAAIGGDVRVSDPELGERQTTGNLGVGVAYRPRNGDVTLLQRAEGRYSDGGVVEDRSVLHAFTAEWRARTDLTLAATHGIRFKTTEIGGVEYDTLTNFGAADIYYNFHENWSLGLHGGALAVETDEIAWSGGVSLGYTLRKGATVRVGFNAFGFEDEDFGATHATAQGVYLRFNLRFDERDVRAILPRFGVSMPEAPRGQP